MIPTRLSVQCRCNRRVCQKRTTLPKHPDEYDIKPRCPKCSKGMLRPDGHRSKGKEKHGPICNPVVTGCSGYSYPHAHGRGWCIYNMSTSPEELQERHERGVWS